MTSSTVLAYIGLTCSSILILALMVFAIVDLKSVNRVTIRLIIGIVIADFLNHSSSILILGSGKFLGKPYCESLAAVITLDRHLYAFTNIAISYHLYRVIVQLKKPSFKGELTVWVILVAVIAILMTTYHFLGVFSGTKNKVSCNPGSNNPAITKVVFGLIGLFDLLAIASGIFVTVLSHKYLDHWIKTYYGRKLADPEDQKQFKESKLKAAKRSFVYPLSSIITLSVEVVLGFWMIFDNPPYILFLINSNMVGLKGILTLLAFCMDQAVWSSAKATHKKLTDAKL